MARGDVPPLRALPRTFLEGIDVEAESLELPKAEYEKLTRVLRLQTGDQLAILPNDGTVLRCELRGRRAWILEKIPEEREAGFSVTLAQALPRAEKLEEVVRMGTEMGVDRFVLFASARSVVRWDEDKRLAKAKRLRTIAVEAAEVCNRRRLPTIEWRADLAEVLRCEPSAIVLSEIEDVLSRLSDRLEVLDGSDVTLVIGPEGGWSPDEVALIGERAATLGRWVLRVDTAAAASVAVAMSYLARRHADSSSPARSNG